MRQTPPKLRCDETPSLKTGKNKKSIIILVTEEQKRSTHDGIKKLSCNVHKRIGKKEKKYLYMVHPVTHSNL